MTEPTAGQRTERIYRGVTDIGELYAIIYGPNGVRWEWGDAAKRYQEVLGPHPLAPSHAGAERARTTSENDTRAGSITAATAALDTAAGLVSATAFLVQAVTGLLVWWEQRQYRLMDSAQFEESRRIPWMYDMMARWVTMHRRGDHLDIDISCYLGREASATLMALVENPKMAVPQAMLYDLELIRRCISGLRLLMRRQFRALANTPSFNINALINRSLGKGLGKPLVLNQEFVQELAGDPAEDWDRLRASNDLKRFGGKFRDLARKPNELFAHAFSYSRPKGSSEVSVSQDSNMAVWTPFMVGFLMKQIPVAAVCLDLGLSAAIYVFERIKSNEAVRRDDFRELALLAAEVQKVQLLHQLWCMVDGVVRSERASGILVLENSRELRLASRSPEAMEFETLAVDRLEAVR